MKKIYLIILLLSLILTGCESEQVQKATGFVTQKAEELSSNPQVIDAKIDLATNMVNLIKDSNLKKINLEAIHSPGDFIDMIDNLNFAIDYTNKHLENDFNPLSRERKAYDNFMTQITKWSPLLDNYNDMIDAAYGFDGTEDTADEFLIAAGGFTIELALIQNKALHKLVFKSVGSAASKLGLLKLNSVCRPCVSHIMKTAYWGSKNFVVEKGSEMWELMYSS